MWLSLAIALLTYLLSSRGTSEQRRKALINAGLAGGATYLATEYTDWGKDLSMQFDDVIGVSKTPIATPNTIVNSDGSVTTPEGTTPPPIGTIGSPNKQPEKGGSLWDTLKSWGPGTTALVGGAVGAAFGGIPMPLIIGGGLLIAYSLLKG